MDLGLSEQQELLKNAARDFLEKECPEKHVREMEEDEKGYSPELWKQMAELGWQGLIIPEQLRRPGLRLPGPDRPDRGVRPGARAGTVHPDRRRRRDRAARGRLGRAEAAVPAQDRLGRAHLDARADRAVGSLRRRGRRAGGEGRRRQLRAERHEALHPRRPRQRLHDRRRAHRRQGRGRHHAAHRRQQVVRHLVHDAQDDRCRQAVRSEV